MKQTNYDTKAIYVFKCKKCGKEGRETVKQTKAEEQLCRKCRAEKADDNQLDLFSNTGVAK